MKIKKIITLPKMPKFGHWEGDNFFLIFPSPFWTPVLPHTWWRLSPSGR